MFTYIGFCLKKGGVYLFLAGFGHFLFLARANDELGVSGAFSVELGLLGLQLGQLRVKNINLES